MNRRDFLKRIIAVPLAVKAAGESEFIWDTYREDWIPEYFYGGAVGGGKSVGWEYFGIPFYENAATYRHGYMGISREQWSKALELPTQESTTQKLQDE